MRRFARVVPLFALALAAGCSDGDPAPTGPVLLPNGLDDARSAIGEALHFTDTFLSDLDALAAGRVVLRPGDDPWRFDAGTGRWIFEMHVETPGATTFRFDLEYRWRFLAGGTVLTGGETAQDDAAGADRVEFSAEVTLSEDRLEQGEIVSAVSERYETSLVIENREGPSGPESHRARGEGSLQLDFFGLEDGRPIEQHMPVDWTVDVTVPIGECPHGRIDGVVEGFLFDVRFDGTDTFRWTIEDGGGPVEGGDGFSACAGPSPQAPWLLRLTESSFFFVEPSP